MARVALPQSKIKARRKRRRIVAASVVAGAAMLIFGALVWLSHAQFMRIDKVVVSGERTINANAISNTVLEDLSGSYLYLFPKNNIFLYPKFKTQQHLLEQIPTIAKVSIEAKDFHTLQVTVNERARKALWCGTNANAPSACFWLDEDGLAYSATSDLKLPNEATSTYMHYFGTLVGASPRQFLTSEQFRALSALIDALAQQQPSIAIKSVEVDSVGAVRVEYDNGFELLFNLSAAGADVYQRFVLALSSEAFSGHKLGDFQYLDLRFGDKLYYKLK
jgi:cell division septal protein FtsQ